MTEYAKLVEKFFTRYESPTIDEYIVGFSGIDPPLKVLASEINHEELDNLLGGDNFEHYHLTKGQWKKVLEMLDELPDPEPEPDDKTEFDGGTSSITEAEYNVNSEFWLDGGFSPDNHEKEFDGGRAAA